MSIEGTISRTYPKLGRQASQITLRTFLNVTGGILEDDNDGSSIYDVSYVSVGIDLIQRILAAEYVSKVHIRIVTMYPRQFRAYEESLRAMHTQDLQKTNSKVTVMSIDRFQGRKIMDLVTLDVLRTRSTDPADIMVEPTQLRGALTIHRDKLVVIGRLPATLERPYGSKGADENTDTFWHVCKWLSDHNRVVVSSEPSLIDPSRSTPIKVESSSAGGEGPAITNNGSDVKRKVDALDDV